MSTKNTHDRSTVSNREDAFEAIFNDAGNLEYCCLVLKDDEELVMAAIELDSYAFEHASDRLKNDKGFILNAIKNDVEPDGLLAFATDAITSDIDVILTALEHDGCDGFFFTELTNDFSLNKELAAKALVKWGSKTSPTNDSLWSHLHRTIRDFFPKDCWFGKAQAYLTQLDQEKQAEKVSGGSTAEDEVVW